MKALSTSVLGLALALPLATGCASRTAPFNDLDQASVTILKLQGQEVAQTPTPGVGAPGTIPMLPIPGLTPEQQQQMQQGIQQLGQAAQQMIPGLQIPGLPGATPTTQPQQQQMRFNGFVILDQRSIADSSTKDELLDTFGHEDSFSQNRGPCFTPGLGVVFQDPKKGNVELMVSFSCNQVQGNGFRWPYQVNGLSPEASSKLRRIYEQNFGPLQPSGV
jgi:hypothetical protein